MYISIAGQDRPAIRALLVRVTDCSRDHMIFLSEKKPYARTPLTGDSL